MSKKFLTKILFICGLMFLSLHSFGQRITINKQKIPLDELFREIKKQTNYDIVLSSSKMNLNQTVDAYFQDEALETVLKSYFHPKSGYQYTIDSRSIVIQEKGIRQDFISGRVLSGKTNSPIQGASIRLINGAITKTDENGVFVADYKDEVRFQVSSMGFKTGTYPTIPNSFLIVKLEDDVETVDEVVVTGIFNRKAESFTGAQTAISGDDLRKMNPTNIFKSISAFDPAFQLVANNAAGSDINRLPDVRMRGENAFPNLTGELSNNPNQPLFILDGFQVSLQRIVDLDMNLIKSITLLKDASATAMYGSRGANGVMVVTTIPPAAGKVQVTFTNDYQLSTPDLSVYDMLNSTEKLDFEKRTGVYSSNTPFGQYTQDLLYNDRLRATLSGVNTDWLGLPVQNGHNNRSTLRLEGGDQTIRYGLQFTANLQQGVIKEQTRDNYSGLVDLSYTLHKFRFQNQLSIYQNKANISPYGSFSQYVTANPYHYPYDENGKFRQIMEYVPIGDEVGYSPHRAINPLFNSTLHSVNTNETFGVNNNLSIRYSILPNLFLESNLGIARELSSADQFFSAQDSRFVEVADINRRGSYTARNGKLFRYENISTANYNLVSGKNQFFTTLGFNIESSNDQFYIMSAEGFPYDRLDNLLFAAGYQTGGRPTGDESTTRRVGFLYNGNYSFDNRYLFDVSIRRDGASQYGTDRRFGTFWSTGAGWNVHNEKLFKDSPYLNRLRIRATYGSTGSTSTTAYASQFRYNFGVSSTYYDQLGASLANMGNRELGWQNVYKFNLGFDIGLFKDRLDMRLDMYKENTMNAITQVTMAPSTGFSTYSENLGKLQNTGLEFNARVGIIQDRAKGVLWNVYVNGFTNKNILKELSNKLKASNDRLDAGNTAQVVPNILFREGESMNTIYAVRSLGVDPATGSEVFLAKDGNMTYQWNAADKVAVGIAQPKWNGNFGSNLSYKGVELSVNFNYQFGGQIYNQTLINRVESVNPRNNVDRRAYELGWIEPGDISQYTRISTSSVPTRLTSRFVQNERNLRLTAASIGYNFFRTNLIKRLGVRSLSLALTTNDVLWLSSVQIERGTDNPFARMYNFNLRVGF